MTNKVDGDLEEFQNTSKAVINYFLQITRFGDFANDKNLIGFKHVWVLGDVLQL